MSDRPLPPVIITDTDDILNLKPISINYTKPSSGGKYIKIDKTKKFINSLPQIVKSKYDFDKVKYVNHTTSVTVKCKIHGNYFEIKPSTLKDTRRGNVIGGCPICFEEFTKSKIIEFLNKLKTLNDNRYEYDMDSYINQKKQFNAICKDHGPFKVRYKSDNPKGHRECPDCVVNKHGSVIYENKTKYFICKTHGKVKIGKNRTLNDGCPTCAFLIRKNEKTESKMLNIKNKFPDYIITLISEDTIKATCCKHNTSKLYPYINFPQQKTFLCDSCYKEYLTKKVQETKSNRINKAKQILQDEYSHLYRYIDYIDGDNSNFKFLVYDIINKRNKNISGNSLFGGSISKTPQKCNILNYLSFEDAKKEIRKYDIKTFREYKQWRVQNERWEFPAHPNRVYKKYGFTTYYDFFGTSPTRDMSRGEKIIKSYLTKQGVEFVYQKTFPDCKNVNLLRFDFYIPKYNLIIEFDGDQHNKATGWGRESFERTEINDQIKNEYCKLNKINLVRIPYEHLTNNYLKKHLGIILGVYELNISL